MPFEPEQAYYAERNIKLNIPYITFIKWKVCISRIHGPLNKVLDDLDLLNVFNMSPNLVISIIRAFQSYLSVGKIHDDREIKDIDNPFIMYHKLYNELRQMAKDGNAIDMDILLEEKMYYKLPSNSIVTIVNFDKKRCT